MAPRKRKQLEKVCARNCSNTRVASLFSRTKVVFGKYLSSTTVYFNVTDILVSNLSILIG